MKNGGIIETKSPPIGRRVQKKKKRIPPNEKKSRKGARKSQMHYFSPKGGEELRAVQPITGTWGSRNITHRSSFFSSDGETRPLIRGGRGVAIENQRGGEKKKRRGVTGFRLNPGKRGTGVARKKSKEP